MMDRSAFSSKMMLTPPKQPPGCKGDSKRQPVLKQVQILTGDDAASGKRSNFCELEIQGGVSVLSIDLFTQYTHLTILHLSKNDIRILPKEIGNLVNLVYLDVSNNHLRALPPEIGELLKLRELNISHNPIVALPHEIGRLYNLYKLSMINVNIMNLPRDMSRMPGELMDLQCQNLMAQLLDSMPANAFKIPPSRRMLSVEAPNTKQVSAVFTVMCYNVLCDKYCTRQLYGYCPPWALSWDYRKKLILEEIKKFFCDIVALQEVETEQFNNFFKPELANLGYEGVFSAKSRARTMTEKEKQHVDGCAIFWKTEHFSLLNFNVIEFNQVSLNLTHSRGPNADLINRVMTKDNIGLAALLQTKDHVFQYGDVPPIHANQPLLIATAHIHWDPEYCDVKLIQTIMLMSELKNIIESSVKQYRPELPPDVAHQDCNTIPLILCGDFNSMPDSGVIQFLQNGKIAANHSDFKEMGYEDCLQKLSTSPDNCEVLAHEFRVRSAYEEDHCKFTNFTVDFKGIIDYVFYSYDYMYLLEVLGPFDYDWFKEVRHPACPAPYIPSDHFPMLTRFQMPVPYPRPPFHTPRITGANSGSNNH